VKIFNFQLKGATMTLQWMEWTLPTAIFVISIFLILVAMTIWQTLAPSMERRGFLPIPTTPGDRLFIGLLGSGYLFLAWLGLTDFSLWILLVIAVCLIIVVMRWG
jgi:predicted small integral membrane protein